MNPDRWNQIEALFHELLELPVSERASRLDQEPADLAEEVRRLVFAADTTGSTFGSLREAAELIVDGVQLEAGRELGDFEVVAPLGRGGMGVVYLATQEQPNRHVALKVMGSGLGSTGSERRFEVEADILARLHHPAIAHVYAAGVLHEGGERLPWFAMELVEDGKPLTDAARGCTLAETLDLFAQCCDGISHAHERGIIHRDLKPSNMLVDMDGHPRIIDFGIALGHGSTSQGGRGAGTPAYMSPEQARGEEVDTRCDIYALGVVLSELVTQPDRTLRAIIDKAGHPDRSERFTSAADLAADVRSYVEGRPVAAVGTGLSYVFGCWIRRNQALTAVAGITVLAALGGAAGWLEASEQSVDAEASIASLEDFLEQANPYKATGPRVSVVEIIERLTEELDNGEVVLPSKVEARSRHTMGETLVSIARYEEATPHLRRATELLEQEHGEESQQAFEARHDYVASLLEQGSTEAFLKAMKRHAELTRSAFGRGSREFYRAEMLHGRGLRFQGLMEEAVEWNWALYQRGVELLPENDPLPYSVLYNYASALRGFDRRQEALPHFQTVLDWRTKYLGSDDLRTIGTVAGFGSFLNDIGDEESMARAGEMFESAYLAYERVLVEDNAASATLKNNYAAWLRTMERIDEAFVMHEEVVAAREKFYLPHHPSTRMSKTNLAIAYLAKAIEIEHKKKSEGLEVEDDPPGLDLYGERCRAILEELLEEEHHLCGPVRGTRKHHMSCLHQRLTLGNYWHVRKEFETAFRLYDEALDLKTSTGKPIVPEGSSTWAYVVSYRTQAWIEMKDYEQAEAGIAQLQEVAEEQQGERNVLMVSVDYCKVSLGIARAEDWIDEGGLDKAEKALTELQPLIEGLPTSRAEAATEKMEGLKEKLEKARVESEDR